MDNNNSHNYQFQLASEMLIKTSWEKPKINVIDFSNTKIGAPGTGADGVYDGSNHS